MSHSKLFKQVAIALAFAFALDAKAADQKEIMDTQYELTGDGSAMPILVYNDGKNTVFELSPNSVDTPIVFKLVAGKQLPVGYRQENKTLIVEGVGREYALVTPYGQARINHLVSAEEEKKTLQVSDVSSGLFRVDEHHFRAHFGKNETEPEPSLDVKPLASLSGKIIIRARTDDSESVTTALKRGMAIKTRLIRAGVSASKIRVLYTAQRFYLVNNTNELARGMNRRVEIELR